MPWWRNQPKSNKSTKLWGIIPFKMSANFHNFWPLPPYHRHSSKMLMKGIKFSQVCKPLHSKYVYHVGGFQNRLILFSDRHTDAISLNMVKLRCETQFWSNLNRYVFNSQTFYSILVMIHLIIQLQRFQKLKCSMLEYSIFVINY